MSNRATDIYLLRHGETEWNTEGRFQGHRDSPLTQQGREQVIEACKKLRFAVPLEDKLQVHVSPLGRTIETGSILQVELPNAECRTDQNLVEVSLGSWDGLTHTDIEAGWPSRLAGADRYDFYFRSPDGEMFDAAFTRAEEWLNSLDGRVIAITHGLFGRMIRGAYLGLSRRETLTLPVSHTSIWRLHGGQVALLGA